MKAFAKFIGFDVRWSDGHRPIFFEETDGRWENCMTVGDSDLVPSPGKQERRATYFEPDLIQRACVLHDDNHIHYISLFCAFLNFHNDLLLQFGPLFRNAGNNRRCTLSETHLSFELYGLR
jgi:hypothetical protein